MTVNSSGNQRCVSTNPYTTVGAASRNETCNYVSSTPRIGIRHHAGPHFTDRARTLGPESDSKALVLSLDQQELFKARDPTGPRLRIGKMSESGQSTATPPDLTGLILGLAFFRKTAKRERNGMVSSPW